MATLEETKEELREAINQALRPYEMTLMVMTWQEDYTFRTVKITLKIQGTLDVQQDLPLTVRG